MQFISYSLRRFSVLALFFFFATSHNAKADDTAPPTTEVTCKWQDATVKVSSWLECKNCVYRYCQCQPDGRWGKCRNDNPPEEACDWSKPDWTKDACKDGGSKPCDWTKPDPSNPACSS